MRGGRGAGRKMPNKREAAPTGRRRADPKDDKPDSPAGTRRQNDQNRNADTPTKRGRNASPAARGSPAKRGGNTTPGRGGRTPPVRGRGKSSPPSRRSRRSSPPGNTENRSKNNRDVEEVIQLDENTDSKSSDEKGSLKGISASSAQGGGKLSDNFGSFMASFFSRHREVEDPEAKDPGSTEDNSGKKNEEEADKGTSSSNVDQQEESKTEVKTEKDGKRDGKLAFKKPPEMDTEWSMKDEAKESSQNESLKEESQAKDTSGKVEGAGSRRKSLPTDNEKRRKPAEVEQSPGRSFDKENSEDKKFKDDVVKQTLDDEGKRKQPWKGEQESSNSVDTSMETGKFTGDVQSPSKKKKPFKDDRSPQKRPPQNNEDDQENNARKVTSSIGALLAGLGGRKSHIMSESSQSPSKQERGQKSSVKEPQPVPDDDVEEIGSTVVENKKPQEKPMKDERKSHKRSFSEANEGDSNNDDSATGNKVTSSIGALLAGLGGRKSRFSEDSKAQENKRKSMKGEYPLTASSDDAVDDAKASEKKPAPKEDQHKSTMQASQPREDNKPMNRSFEQGKAKANANQSVLDDKSQGDNAQAKVTSSIGALLAGLGSRRNQASEPPKKDTYQASELPKKDTYQASEPPKKDSYQTSEQPEKVTSQSTSGDAAEDPQASEKPQPANDRKPKTMPAKRDPPANVDDGDEEQRIEHKKSLGLGALLSGLGNRQRSEQPQNNRQSLERERDSHMPNRGRRQGGGGFGDFGYVSKAMKMNDNRKGGWDAPPDSESPSGDNRRGGWDAPQDSEPQWDNRKGGWDSGPQRGNRNRPDRGNNKRGWDMSDRATDSDGSFNRRDKKSRFSNDYEEPEQDERPPTVREEDDVLFVLGHTPKAKPNEKELENNKKSLANNMTFEEEAERKKSNSIGAMLAGLATRSFPEPPPPRERPRESSYERSYGRPRESSFEISFDGDKDIFGRERDRNWAKKEPPKEDDWKSQDRKWDNKEKKSRGKKEDEPFDVKKAAEKVKTETKRLEEEYGVGVFTVGFTEKRQLAVVCEICCVQLSENLIESHTDGMQHLKKKNVWDKKQRMLEEGKNSYSGGRRGWVKVDPEEEKLKSKTASPAPTSSTENSNSGYETNYQQNYNRGGYNYNTDQSYGTGYGGKGSGYIAPNTSAAVPAAIVNTAIPPPPPPIAEAPAKSKPAKGGATVSLLQRLDACAVKTEKDLDLATSVISALLKSLKEFNHKRGDTKCIEVLTEIDIKFRGLKPKAPASDDKSSGKVNAASSSSSRAAYDTSNPELVSAHRSAWYSQGSGSATPASSTHMAGKTSSSSAQGAASSSNVQGTASSYGMKTSDGYTSGYSTQPPVKSDPAAAASTGYGQYSTTSGYGSSGTAANSYSNNYYNASYPILGKTDNKTSSSQSYPPPQGTTDTTTKDKTMNYYTQPPPPVATQGGYVDPNANKAATNIVYSTSHPPPPPPTDAAQNYAAGSATQNYDAGSTTQNYAAGSTTQNYAAQGYQSAYNMGYYSMPAPLPQYNNQQQY